MRALPPSAARRTRSRASRSARLIDANRRDQAVTRYRHFDELLDYCQLSAAPVGELVLHVFGARDAASGSRCPTRSARGCS